MLHCYVKIAHLYHTNGLLIQLAAPAPHPSHTRLVRGGCRAPITVRERLRRRCCILGLSELPLTDVLDCAPYTPWWRRASTPALRSTCSPPGAGDSSAGSSSSAALPWRSSGAVERASPRDTGLFCSPAPTATVYLLSLNI